MQGMFQLGRVTAACKLLGKMLASGLVPSQVTYMILLAGLCKSGKLKVALKIFQAMRNRGLELDIIFYNILIDGLCKAGHIEDAKELFHKLSVEGVFPKQQYLKGNTTSCGNGREGLFCRFMHCHLVCGSTLTI
ncbi:hypothetical protein V6N13_014605 [Hibiscus sabdariffa]